VPDLVLAALEQGDGLRLGVVGATFLYGLRHGIDLDHLAAIADITSSQNRRSRSLGLATVYALGHAAVVLVLGSVAVVTGRFLPRGVDAVMEHIVGISLLLLGSYVFYSVIRYGRDFRLKSRWMLLFGGARRTLRWLRGERAPQHVEIEHTHSYDDPAHDHGPATAPQAAGDGRVTVRTERRHRHVVTLPDDPFLEYGVGTSAVVGMIHGIGAETPSQVLLLITAAGIGGPGTGMVLLATFIVGLLLSNTAVAAASTVGFAQGRRAPTIYLTLALVTGAASLAMGGLYLAGKADLLPSIFG